MDIILKEVRLRNKNILFPLIYWSQFTELQKMYAYVEMYAYMDDIKA